MLVLSYSFRILNHFESEEELQAIIEDYIYFYNYQRFQR
ncbi:IS3 family transposase [Peribacillus simplex]